MALCLEQSERIEALIVKYQRLGRVSAEVTPVDVNRLMREIWVGVAAARAPSDVRPELDLADDLPPCRVDPDLLGVAVQNVLVNALEAMPNGGTLRVKTCAETDEQGVGTLSVVITDSGMGMDSRQLERVLDDFYTTKAAGSGLGLGFSERVVQAHGGHLRLRSQPGRGTTVRIELPLVASDKGKVA